mmetsp:Transcript_8145/g.11537  ORF Transcript_8145/g.11537 Transcript_8145/m.11537 type:complete len:83 (+) Transcript_8145:1782-2030(+)
MSIVRLFMKRLLQLLRKSSRGRIHPNRTSMMGHVAFSHDEEYYILSLNMQSHEIISCSSSITPAPLSPANIDNDMRIKHEEK